MHSLYGKQAVDSEKRWEMHSSETRLNTSNKVKEQTVVPRSVTSEGTNLQNTWSFCTPLNQANLLSLRNNSGCSCSANWLQVVQSSLVLVFRVIFPPEILAELHAPGNSVLGVWTTTPATRPPR